MKKIISSLLVIVFGCLFYFNVFVVEVSGNSMEGVFEEQQKLLCIKSNHFISYKKMTMLSSIQHGEMVNIFGSSKKLLQSQMTAF